MSAKNTRWLRRVAGAGLCCAGLVLAGVLSSTDGQPMPPIPGGGGSAAVNAGQADSGAPVPPAPW